MSVSGITFNGLTYTALPISPGTIAANTSAAVPVTLNGILTTDVIISVNKPTVTAGVDTGSAIITAANKASIVFQNSSASGVGLPTETYIFVIGRPENVLGGPDAPANGNVIFK